MNALERAILEELKKDKNAKDTLSETARLYREPQKPKQQNKRKYLLAAALTAAFLYADYCLCKELVNSEVKPLAIPAAIWGICGASYALRKISSER